MLGLPKGEVFLLPWTEEWVAEFLLEKNRMETEIGELILTVHHIGSTAVRSLSAKPIIDIAIELEDFEQGYRCVQGLESLGYSYKGTNILPDRHYFNKGEPRTHQIHMYQKESSFLSKQLAFRDYLIQHEEARKEYQTLKERLSLTHSKDKLTYADNKTEFVNSILKRLGFDME
ncbi:GrpB family protein [Paenibacillus contaminans]|uniref:GrpB family protein n=1 Tax=Paenibacillus contaminans TaxID=450362 RepID=A0A329MMP2_9BACL|nr:GrpB family protein [Paenibacillus contaminans]RAV21211.1 GrpB family protein [Paenibacillus contaminans]